jgi:hypothetical protein
MVERGIGNSRMKDYFDLWVFMESFEFDGAMLTEAIRATFDRQRTLLPTAVPVGLTNSFGQHPEKLARVAGVCEARKAQVRERESARGCDAAAPAQTERACSGGAAANAR